MTQCGVSLCRFLKVKTNFNNAQCNTSLTSRVSIAKLKALLEWQKNQNLNDGVMKLTLKMSRIKLVFPRDSLQTIPVPQCTFPFYFF